MNAEQLRQLAEIFRDEIEAANEGTTTAETLRRISDRIFELAADGDYDEGVVAPNPAVPSGLGREEEAPSIHTLRRNRFTSTYRVGDAVRAAEDIIGGSRPSRTVLKGTHGIITAASKDEWVTVRFDGVPRDWRCHVVEVDR